MMNSLTRRILIAALGLPLFLIGCSEAPVTGRRQLKLVPEGTLNAMSVQEYQKFLAQNPPSADAKATAAVQEVGQRIRQAVHSYLRETGELDRIQGFNWEFNLVESDQVNAFAMPGGKVVFFEGILPVAQNEAGIATVMGHEIAHVVAGHGNERVSQGLLAQMGGMALSQAMAQSPAETRDLFLKAYGATTQVGVLLPYSRLHENEADHLGLIFMALAGYDPHEAVDFWQRMAAAGSASEGPAFLRTHPPTQQRIANIQSLIPEVMPYYRGDTPIGPADPPQQHQDDRESAPAIDSDRQKDTEKQQKKELKRQEKERKKELERQEKERRKAEKEARKKQRKDDDDDDEEDDD